MMGSETDKIIKELFESLLQRYQEGLEESVKGSEFFYSVDILYYNLNKIGLNHGRSYIDSKKIKRQQYIQNIMIISAFNIL